MYITDGLILTDSKFEKNESNVNAALRVEAYTLQLRNVTFEDNISKIEDAAGV